MTFDCIAFQESTTNNGLLPVAPAAGQPHGYLVAGDDMQMKWAGRVLMAINQTAAIANFVQARFGSQDDPALKWPESQTLVRDQTGAMVDPALLTYLFKKNAIMNCDHDHGANAQVASTLLLVSDGKPKIYIRERPTGIPDNARWIVATGATAGIANTWVEDAVTYSYSHAVDMLYDVYGIRAFEATGYGFRIHPQDEPKKYRPGWILGDTNILLQSLYTETPMISYSGRTPPLFDKLGSGTGTAARYEMLVVEK